VVVISFAKFYYRSYVFAIVATLVVTMANFEKEHMLPVEKKDQESNDQQGKYDLFSPEDDKKAVEKFEAELAAAHEHEERRRKIPKEALAKGRTTPIAVRFDEFTLKRLRVLAARRNTGYQTLLKEFVVERLYEEEKREGIIE
jgi:hypothetical protein